MTWFVEPWTFPFMRWALLCCLVLAGIHAYLGFHVVRRGVLFVDLAMAQMAALGAAVGIVLGLEHDTPGEYAISAGFALAAAGAFALIRSRRVNQEAIVAIFYAMAMAATFVVLEHSPHGMEEVRHLLMGQVLTVAPGKIMITAATYVAIGTVLYAFHRRILAVTEDRLDGPAARAAEFVFYGMFALVVTSSVGMVGVLLVFAFLAIPAVTALVVPRGGAAPLLWGWGLASVGSLLGLHLAFHWDQPAAPVIVLVLGALLLVAALANRVAGSE